MGGHRDFGGRSRTGLAQDPPARDAAYRQLAYPCLWRPGTGGYYFERVYRQPSRAAGLGRPRFRDGQGQPGFPNRRAGRRLRRGSLLQPLRCRCLFALYVRVAAPQRRRSVLRSQNRENARLVVESAPAQRPSAQYRRRSSRRFLRSLSGGGLRRRRGPSLGLGKQRERPLRARVFRDGRHRPLR